MAYKPPKQSLAGQIVDVVVLLVLTVGALYLPLYMVGVRGYRTIVWSISMVGLGMVIWPLLFG